MANQYNIQKDTVTLVDFNSGKKLYFYDLKALELEVDRRTANYEEYDFTCEEGIREMLNFAYPREGGVKLLSFRETLPEWEEEYKSGY